MSKFRTNFQLLTKVTKWFPGHMTKGMRTMQKLMKTVDVVIEVHDARIPLTGRNNNFKAMTSAKSHILVLNKVDLTDMRYETAVENKLLSQGVDRVIYTELSGNRVKKQCDYHKILPSIMGLMRNSERYNRADASDFNIMVVGIPNVGKSCLINRLRSQYLKKGTVAKVGALAGVTTAVTERIRLCSNPPMFILDTPGILEPKAKNVEAYFKHALISSLSDEVVGIELIADYLLYWLNKNEHFSYVDYFGIGEPSDSISEVLFKIAISQNKMRRIRMGASKELSSRPDFQIAADVFVKSFRNGHLGRFFLDELELESSLDSSEIIKRTQ